MRLLTLTVGMVILAGGALAAQLKLDLPLSRKAYQTNETIDLAVTRSDTAVLAATNLTLTVTGADASRLTFTFPLAAVAVAGADARATEHLHLNGWLLRPGHYTLEARAYDTAATAEIDVFSHIRKTSYKLIDWGSRGGKDTAVLGEDSMGFNLLYAAGNGDASIRGGMDYMGCCIMSGGHQMDLRMECDWSDPYVLGGARSRVVRAALQFRATPNAIGVHFYDEPGLTWYNNPRNDNKGTPHDVPAQVRSFEAAQGKPYLSAYDVKPDNPEQAAAWRQWAQWKLGFMDAAWKDASFGVSLVRPDFQSVTQSQYGWTAFTDGYYFNVVRSLPVISGHGGYDDIGPGYFCPSEFLEMARARDFARPCWYLPTWYGNTRPEAFRLEQYLSFMTNIQGVAKPPDMAAHTPGTCLQADAIVETNRAMARLGTIFTTMPVTRAKVAVLYSLSHLLRRQLSDMEMNYAHGDPHGANLSYTYLALKMIQQPMTAVVDEDIRDGTCQQNHAAVVLTSITYLDPPLVQKLEEFIARGGLVLMTGDCKVGIKGAVNLGVVPRLADQEQVDRIMKDKKYDLLGPYMTTGKQLAAALPLAKAIRTELDKAGIKPAFGCDRNGIAAGCQAYGDIEYLFAANATYDEQAARQYQAAWTAAQSDPEALKKLAVPRNALAPTVAAITLADDGRPVYDAMLGGPASFEKRGKGLLGSFRFGPGQMRAFARTARPVGGVTVAQPTLYRDYTVSQAPFRVTLSATLLDTQGKVLSGSAPLQITITDPLGAVRYELFRATDNGTCRITLPLAVNDPVGVWSVTVQELLANTVGKTAFEVVPTVECGALAGGTARAVCFGEDRDNVFRMVRVHKSLTIVKGTAEYCAAAAERLASILKPWDVQCTVVNAADVNRARELSAAEALTWCGIDYAPRGQVKPGRDNPPALVGYDVRGAVILLGTPQDNPLIAAVAKQKVLPYAPSADFPGRGRGMLAWQLDILGRGVESVCLIADDAAGMAEAVGSFYEAAAGMNPLTPFVLPVTATVVPAAKADLRPAAAAAWTVSLADRAVSLKVDGDAVTVFTWDGSSTAISAAGKASAARTVKELPVAEKPNLDVKALAPDRLVADRAVKTVVAGSNGLTAVGYWGGTLQVFDAEGSVRAQQLLPQDICALAWAGDKLIAALADGRIMALVIR